MINIIWVICNDELNDIISIKKYENNKYYRAGCQPWMNSFVSGPTTAFPKNRFYLFRKKLVEVRTSSIVYFQCLIGSGISTDGYSSAAPQ